MVKRYSRIIVRARVGVRQRLWCRVTGGFIKQYMIKCLREWWMGRVNRIKRWHPVLETSIGFRTRSRTRT